MCYVLKNASPSVNTMIHTFAHILSRTDLTPFRAEIWGMFETEPKRRNSRSLEVMFNDLFIEK